jgi:hypothetical protein
VSTGASWPATPQPSSLSRDTLSRALASTLLIFSPRPVLTQADFEKYQEQSSAKPERYQGDAEHAAGQSADRRGADHTSGNQCGGGAKRQDA